MRRLISIALGLIATVLVIVIVGLAGFRTATWLRETQLPQQAAEPGALFANADDLAIHYKVWGSADGRPLILIPGTMAWSETFRDIAAPLGEQDFRVIAPDLPPFGYSERPLDGNYSRAAQARRILAFADALKLDRFALAVHSYGGGATIEAAFIAPQRIDALVLLDVAMGLDKKPTSLPSPLLDRSLRNLLVSVTFTNPLMLGKGLRDFIADDSLVTAERIEIYARPLTVQGTTAAIGDWLRTGLFKDEGSALSANIANYHSFAAPVLVIWGRDDTVTPLPQGEQIAASLPNAELEVLDGVNHIPQVERPADVVRLIADFLGKHPAEPQ